MGAMKAVKALKADFSNDRPKMARVVKAAKQFFKPGHVYGAKELKEFTRENRGILGTRAAGQTIAGKTTKNVAATLFGPKTDPHAAEAATLARQEALANKQAIDQKLQAKTASEHKDVEGPKKEETRNIATERGKDTIKASRESAAAADTEQAKHNGHQPTAEAALKATRERAAPVQLTKAPIMVPRHDETGRIVHGGSGIPLAGPPAKHEPAVVSEPNAAPTEAPKVEVNDMDIG